MNTTKALPRRCKSSTKEFLCVDIRKMHRQGQLRSDASTVITDRAGHAETQLAAQTDQVTIRHGIRLLAGFRELARQTIKLDKTPCHYGGERSWFRCPGCDRRVAVLYGQKLENGASVKNRRFKCRRCHNFVYLGWERGASVTTRQRKPSGRCEFFRGNRGWRYFVRRCFQVTID